MAKLGQQSTTINTNLTSFNPIWDRLQLVVYFVQETALGMLYIYQTRKYLRQRSPLLERSWSTATPHGHGHHVSSGTQPKEQKTVLWQLLVANILIIALDITLLGIQCANLFYLQGAFKPCVYGIKLKIEFAILNRLISTIRAPAGVYAGSGHQHHPEGTIGGTRHKGAWNKPSGVEGMDAVQLVESTGRGLRSHSAESQVPIYGSIK